LRETGRERPIDRDRQRELEASSERQAKIENDKENFSSKKSLSCVYIG
jgi:hypothetical protein